MGLKETFVQGVETAFKVFKDAVEEGIYSIEIDDGFVDSADSNCEVRVIVDSWNEEDRTSSLYDLVQPTDVKGLVPGIDFTIPVAANNSLKVGNDTFSMVAFETDAYKALYTILLRK